MKAETLEAIIHFTDQAHGQQKRKYTGERYIVHPIRVMQTCQQYTHDPCLLSAALLHDVLEDTTVTKEEISHFLSDFLSEDEVAKTLHIVEELTDVFTKKNFSRLNRRARKAKEIARLSATSWEAQTVKYADVIDNAVDIVEHDTDFGYVYLTESQDLLRSMKSGHPALHERALHTVTECRDRVKKLEINH